MQNQVITIFIISLATLAAIHILALQFFLYWRYEWFDMPMHLFGGAVVALGVFAARELNIPFFIREVTFNRVLASVLLIAIAWELFEFTGGISVVQETFILDTATDIVAGILGGSIGFWVGKSIVKDSL